MKSVKRPADTDRRKLLENKFPGLVRREVRAATLFAHTVAENSGMHITDIRCLDFLSEKGSATAGDLAKVTGLTSGAVTAVIDRMKRAGRIECATDKNDRRKTIITLAKGHHDLQPATRDLFSHELPALLSEYTENELRTIESWNTKLVALLRDRTDKLKSSKKQQSK